MNTSHWQVPETENIEFAPKHTEYCVCIPVFNEGERIKTQLDRMNQIQIAKKADILILDGGSSDHSLDLKFLKSRKVRTLLIKTGPGKLSAQLRMGYAYALLQGYEGIITVDGNNKDGIEAIPNFIRELKSGIDFVQGSRFIKGGKAVNTPLSRLFAIRMIHSPIVNLASRFRYSDTTNGFRGYSRQLLLDPELQPFRNIFDTYELLVYLSVKAPRLGYTIKEIPVTRTYPPGETPTKISPLKGNLLLLSILIKAVLDRYNIPK